MSRFFASGAMDEIDMMSLEFLNAFRACEGFLTAAVPVVDPEQRTEQTERGWHGRSCPEHSRLASWNPDRSEKLVFGEGPVKTHLELELYSG